jgi:hypothetical protein
VSDLLIADLLEELGAKNRVRVTKYAAVRADPRGRTIQRRVLDELADPGIALAPALVLHDELRILSGRKPIYLAEALRRLGGDLRSVSQNLRTNVGINWVAANVAGTDGGQVAIADYIAISNNTLTPAITDSVSTLPWSTNQTSDAAASGTTGEANYSGMARKQAAMAHTAASTTYTASATFTASGTVTAMRMAGLFGGTGKTVQGTGSLILANTYTSTTLANGDSLALTWSISF